MAGTAAYYLDGSTPCDPDALDHVDVSTGFAGAVASTYCFSVGSCNLVETSTTYTQTGTGTCLDIAGGGSGKITGNYTETLSVEYTTAQLKSDTLAALPAYPGTWSGTCSSLQDLSTDELTDTIRRVKFRFTFPNLTGYQCWGFDYAFRFHPDGGGPVVPILESTYNWNGVDTELIIEILEGAQYGETANGVITLDGVEYFCTCP